MPVNRILDALGKPIAHRNGAAAPPRNGAATHHKQVVRARYDAAELSRETRNHWAEADALSAKAANSIQVRQRLRMRARYEVANNSYARGIVETIANDTIGTGPRLQMLTPDVAANRAIENGFACWSKEVGLPEKLRTMRKAKIEDGEAFGLLTTNPKLNCPVKLDLKPLEADQVATPLYFPFDPLATDGIRYDEHGNPTEYHVLKYHPGDLVHLAPYGSFDRVPADLMLHWFRVDRPGQLRGIPEITPALPLFGQLRRYTLAVLAAAETAADFAAVLYSELPADADDAVGCEPFEALDIERRMMMTLPAGWKMSQFKPEQPATTYKEFKAEILDEAIRCICMPHNIGLGNSSGYNYSSGRLDHQTYYKALRVEKSQAERVAVDTLLAAYLAEARLTTDMIPPELTVFPHQWFWDGHEHVDPEKEANAQGTRLKNRTTTYASEYARQGQDYEVAFRQIAKEVALMTELGITPEQAASALRPAKQTPNDGGGDAVEPDDD